MYVNAVASLGRGSGVDGGDVKVPVAVHLNGAMCSISDMLLACDLRHFSVHYQSAPFCMIALPHIMQKPGKTCATFTEAF